MQIVHTFIYLSYLKYLIILYLKLIVTQYVNSGLRPLHRPIVLHKRILFFIN
jgi:hypothetical protein